MASKMRVATTCIIILFCSATVVNAQSSEADIAAQAKARIQAMATLAATDPELANHFGLFMSRPVSLDAYGGMLVAAANIITTVTAVRTSPEALAALAVKEKLFSENAYGASVVLDAAAMCRLLSLATNGRYAVSLAHRVEGRVPNDEAREAEDSADLFVDIAYLDHTPMIETSIAWNPDGSIGRVRVVNPLASVAGEVPYKTKSEYGPSAFDSWEFYRFKKTIK
jgi:hypothetical protein